MKARFHSLSLLIVLPLCVSASAQELLSLGAGKPEMDVVAKAGQGTRQAWLSGQLSQDNAVQFCGAAQPEAVETCVTDLLASEEGRLYVLTANCEDHTLTTAERDTFVRVEQGQWQSQGGKTAEGGDAIFDRHWDILCPPAIAEVDHAAVAPKEVEIAALAVPAPVNTPTPAETVTVKDHASSIAGIDHNGSLMWFDQARGVIYYDRPKSSLTGIVAPGTVLFQGTPWTFAVGSRLSGTAYTFRKGCAPAPYAVSGELEAGAAPDFPDRIVLRGASPIRAKNGCAVLGFTEDSSNAVLVFELHYGDV